jgi:hypothetical protein
LEIEHDNLRAALSYCLESASVVRGSLSVAETRQPIGDRGDQPERVPKPQTTNHEQRTELGLRLGGALWPFWVYHFSR